jgi:hypothetical protein
MSDTIRYRPEVAAVIVVGVEPPPEAGVKFFRSVDIRDRNDDYLKLCIEICNAGTFVSSFLLTSLVLIADSCLVGMAAVLIALKDRASGPYQAPTEAP